MRKLGLLVLIAVALAWLAYSGMLFGNNAQKTKDKIADVAVAQVLKGSIDDFVSALGTITPHNSVTVHSRVDGQLLSLHFEEGQWIKQGDPLAEIDDRTYQAQLTQAQGQKMKDEAALQEAKQTLDRYKTLFAKDAIPRQQLDTQASLVKQLEGAVKNDMGAISNATTLLDYTRITAPISGRVGLRQVDPGNIVHSSDTAGIVVITEVSPISAIFTVPEDKIPALQQRLKQDNAITVEAWNRDNSALLSTGTFTAMDNQVDAATGTLKIRADFPNQDGALFPNQFVNIRLKLDTAKDQLLVPTSALQRGSKGQFVYRVKDDETVEIAEVVVKTTQGSVTSVASGVDEHDKVVTEGVDSLRSGSKVHIIDGKAKNKKKAAPSQPE